MSYYDLLNTGGLLLGDDYWSRSEREGTEGWGVGRAVDEFVENHKLELITAKNKGRVYAIRKPQ